MAMAVAAAESKMRAAVAHRPGRPKTLGVESTDRPAVADAGVLVRVHASSVNPVDLFALTPVGYLQRGFKTALVGTDFAGVVEEVGKGVTGFHPGDEVFGAARGAFAEYVCATEGKGVVHKPAGVSFEDAGSVAVAGLTALQALRDHGHVEPGQRVLINGAAGGVGTFAVQVAKALGAEVTAVCSTSHVEIARSLGAFRVLDYTTEDFAAGGDRYDLMLDVAGSRSWADCRRVLKEGATYVAVGVAALQHRKGGGWRAIGHLLGARVYSIRSGVKFVFFIARVNDSDLIFLGDLLASGRVRAVIDRRYGLADVGAALQYLDEGHAGGKIAVEVEA